MRGPLFLKLSRRHGARVLVNMNRVLFIDPSEFGATLTMNIPGTFITVQESPADILGAIEKEQDDG